MVLNINNKALEEVLREEVAGNNIDISELVEKICENHFFGHFGSEFRPVWEMYTNGLSINGTLHRIFALFPATPHGSKKDYIQSEHFENYIQ